MLLCLPSRKTASHFWLGIFLRYRMCYSINIKDPSNNTRFQAGQTDLNKVSATLFLTTWWLLLQKLWERNGSEVAFFEDALFMGWI